MEPYDKKANPGPYFYHVQKLGEDQEEKDGKDRKNEVVVFEFDPILLADYIASSGNGQNPFNKQKFSRVELMRLDRLARWKQPQRPPLQIDRILNGLDGGEHNDELEEELRQLIFEGMREMEQKQQSQRSANQIQQLFQFDPSQMITFLESQAHMPQQERTHEWVLFMQALSNLAARRFERVHSTRGSIMQERVVPEWPRPWISRSQPVPRPSWSSGGN